MLLLLLLLLWKGKEQPVLENLLLLLLDLLLQLLDFSLQNVRVVEIVRVHGRQQREVHPESIVINVVVVIIAIIIAAIRSTTTAVGQRH